MPAMAPPLRLLEEPVWTRPPPAAPVGTAVWKGTVVVGVPVYVTITTPELVGLKGAEGLIVPVATMPPLEPPAMSLHWLESEAKQ